MRHSILGAVFLVKNTKENRADAPDDDASIPEHDLARGFGDFMRIDNAFDVNSALAKFVHANVRDLLGQDFAEFGYVFDPNRAVLVSVSSLRSGSRGRKARVRASNAPARIAVGKTAAPRRPAS
jgi:hypothetical protein